MMFNRDALPSPWTPRLTLYRIKKVPLCILHLHPLSILLGGNFDMRVDQPMKLISLSSPVVQSTLEFLVLGRSGLPGYLSPAAHPHTSPDNRWIMDERQCAVCSVQSLVGEGHLVDRSRWSSYQLLGCTYAFWGNINHKNIRCLPPYTYTVSAPCFPRWSLLQSNVCAPDGYTGLWRREGRCHFALLTVGLGLFPSYFPARLWS